jgi:hypothetical protein
MKQTLSIAASLLISINCISQDSLFVKIGQVQKDDVSLNVFLMTEKPALDTLAAFWGFMYKKAAWKDVTFSINKFGGKQASLIVRTFFLPDNSEKSYTTYTLKNNLTHASFLVKQSDIKEFQSKIALLQREADKDIKRGKPSRMHWKNTDGAEIYYYYSGKKLNWHIDSGSRSLTIRDMNAFLLSLNTALNYTF